MEYLAVAIANQPWSWRWEARVSGPELAIIRTSYRYSWLTERFLIKNGISQLWLTAALLLDNALWQSKIAGWKVIIPNR